MGIAPLKAASASFVEGGAYLTVASLLAKYPATPALIGRYARVNDLYGNVMSVMVCESNTDQTMPYWRPQRDDYSTLNTSTGGTQALSPLFSAPTQVLTGVLTSSMTIQPSATNAWPGAQFTLIAKGTIPALLGITITGLTGGALALLAGGTRTLIYTTSGWQGT